MKPKPPKNPLKAARKGSREAEIAMYSHPLPQHKVHKSKRQYNRKIEKSRPKKDEIFLSRDEKIYRMTTPFGRSMNYEDHRSEQSQRGAGERPRRLDKMVAYTNK